MKILKYSDDISKLMAWANKVPSNNESYEKYGYRKDKPPKAFYEWVKEQMPAENSDIHFWVTHIYPLGSKIVSLAEQPMSVVEWNKGFPHKHSISMGWEKNIHTLMTYLQPADLGGEIGLSGYTNGPYTLYKPHPGMAVLVDSEEWHGVKPVLKGERITILATGFPQEFNGKIPGFRD